MDTGTNQNFWLRRFFRQVAQFVYDPSDEAAAKLRTLMDDYQASVRRRQFLANDPHEILMDFQ